MDDADYLAVNHANWESRVPLHAASDEYGLARFVADPARLSDVVAFDRDRLGSVVDLDVVHLQCHIGTDTLSLARLGARVVGVDFSASALKVARQLATDTGDRVDYVESDVYAAPKALAGRRFDLVYTGIGALCWLPSVDRWAEVVAALLRPGGRLFIREGHPMMWALADPRDDGVVAVEFPYFETQGVVFEESETYVEHAEPLESPRIVHFNHGLGELFTALGRHGLTITDFVEHDSAPWSPLGDQCVADERGEYRLRDRPERLAMTYTLQAVRRGTDLPD